MPDSLRTTTASRTTSNARVKAATRKRINPFGCLVPCWPTRPQRICHHQPPAHRSQFGRLRSIVAMPNRPGTTTATFFQFRPNSLRPPNPTGSAFVFVHPGVPQMPLMLLCHQLRATSLRRNNAATLQPKRGRVHSAEIFTFHPRNRMLDKHKGSDKN